MKPIVRVRGGLGDVLVAALVGGRGRVVVAARGRRRMRGAAARGEETGHGRAR